MGVKASHFSFVGGSLVGPVALFAGFEVYASPLSFVAVMGIRSASPGVSIDSQRPSLGLLLKTDRLLPLTHYFP